MSFFSRTLEKTFFATAFALVAGGAIYGIVAQGTPRDATQKEYEDKAVSVLQEQNFKNPVFVSSAAATNDPRSDDMHLRFKVQDEKGATRIVELDVNGFVYDSNPPSPKMHARIISVATP